MREAIPFLLAGIVAIVVSYHVISSRPSPEEYKMIEEEKTARKIQFDRNFEKISFEGTVKSSRRTVTRTSIGNTKFYIVFEQDSEVSMPSSLPKADSLYDFTNVDSSLLVLGGLDGRKLRRGDKLIKEEGVNYIEVPRTKLVDTISFSWKLF